MARASTALNIIQQAGASIGTAVLSVVLASALGSQLGGGHGTIGATAGVSDAARAHLAAPMAAAFGKRSGGHWRCSRSRFVASLALPKRKPQVAGDARPRQHLSNRLTG